MSSLRRTDLGAGLTRSAAFRLTLRFAAVFVVCLLLADLVVGSAARWVVRREALSAVEDTLGTLKAAFETGGADAVVDAFRDAADSDEMVLGYQDAGGSLRAGDLVLSQPSPGWAEVIPPGADADEGVWVKSVRLPDGGWLSVGASTEMYHDIAEMMQAGALWTVAIALPLALISGALLSRAVLARLGEIASTAEAVREGSLSRRAPVSSRGDEFDRLAADLNAMLDTIEALTRNLRNVTVGIAHELRGPLARIRNRLEEVREAAPAANREVADTSLAEIDATLATFDALLRIGEIEAKARRKDFQMVDFSALVAELAEVYAPVAAEQGKLVDARIAAGVMLRGDRRLLMQMISNLLENAIEHTPQGTQITVELSATRHGQQLIVQDDGQGIPTADSERVFDRFYRLDAGASRRGMGLGLSLVRSICGLHGFVVRLDPTAAGARFEVSMGGRGALHS
jgi:signal transduction histidine kinase